MAARRALGLVMTLAACRHELTARDRLLAEIPGDVVGLVVADGPAIASPRIRGALDVAASRWPSSMGCVLEAAFTSEQAALSIDRAGNLAAILASSTAPACAALSQRAPGVWIATVGAGPAAAPTSVLDDARFARARPYLQSAPIAAALLDEVHAIATAQPEPLAAWLALDSPAGAAGAAAIERGVAAQIARLGADPALRPLATRLAVSRVGDSQVVVQLDAAGDVDLATAARTVLAWADEQVAEPAQPACPDLARPCRGAASYHVASLRDQLPRILSEGRAVPAVANGEVTGLRLAAPVASLGLATGDVVAAIAGRLVVSRAMFLHLAAQARAEITLTIRRGSVDARTGMTASETVLDVVEP